MKKSNVLKTGLVFFLLTLMNVGFAQTITMPTGTGTGSSNTCSGTILDPGGAGNYANSQGSTYTICSSTPGQAPKITFTAFNTESGFDYVYIYNGSSTASPLLASYTGTTLPAAVTGTGSCITIYFSSDFSTVSSGFSATISCVTPPPPPVPNNQDCLGAIPVCQSVYTNNTSYSGTGNYPNEINPGNVCLLSGEKNDVWYQFTVQTSGNLCFVINPNVGTDDYDWAVFNLTSNNCSDIYTNGALDVACDYSGQTTYNATPAQHPSWGGPTGAGNTGMVPNQNASDLQMEPCLAVTAGQSFVLNVSNFSSSQNGYTLNFPPPGTSGMATIFDNIPPAISSLVSTPSCGATSFSFNFSENVQCNTVSAADFTLSGPGGPYTVTAVSGLNCTNGAPSENTYTVTTSPAITTSGTYSLCLVTSAGSVADLCGNTAPAGCFTFNITGPTVAVTPTNPNCSTGTGSITATGSGGTGSGYTYSINNGATFQASGTFTGLAAGTYTVIVKDGGGCRGQAITTITIPPPLTVSLTPTNATCVGGNGSIASTVSGGTPGYTYAWSPSGTGANPTGLGANTYSVTVTDTKGCTATANTTITQTGAVTSTFTSSANQCLNTNSFTFTNTGTVAATHAWTFPSGTPSTSSATSPTGVTWAAAGTYTVTHTVTSGSCTSTNTITITVFPRPTGPTLTPVNPTCGNSNGSITVGAATGGTPAYQYNLNGGTNSALTNYTGQAAGTYTVNVTDANGCTNNSTVTLTNVPGPTGLTLTQSTAHCGQSDGSITIGAVTGGTAGYTYSFNNTAGPFTATSPITSLAAGTYSVTVKDANGCVFTNTIAVANAAGPTGPNATAVAANCGNANGSVTLAPPTTGTGPFTYSFNGGAFSATTSFTSLSANTYTYVVKDNFGCPLNGSITVNNNPGPTALALTQTPSTCGASNGQIAIGAVTGGTGPYTYSFNGGAFTATSPITGLASGVTYTVTVKDVNGCTFTSTIAVTNSAGPTNVALTSTAATCGASNGSVTIGAVTGGTGPYTYSYDGGAFAGTTSFTAQAANTHTVTVKDANGCTYTATIAVSNSGGPTALNANATASACVPNNGTVTITGQTGGVAPYTYSFNGSPFTATTSYTGIAQGTYPVVVKDNNGCQFAITVTVSVTPSPTAQVVTPVNSTCGNANGTATFGATTGGTGPYTYSFNGGAFSATTTYTASAGTYNVSVKDANGCQFSTTTTIANTPGPTAVVLTPVNSTCGSSNGQVNVGAVTTSGSTSFQYSIDGGALQAGTSFTGLSATTHTVLVQDANGCQYSTTVNVANTPGPTGQAVTNTNSTCGLANGTVTIGATTGGTAAYQYSFDGGAFGATTTFTVSAGTHTVVVKDANACTYTVTTVVANTAGPTAVALTTTPSNCGNPNGAIAVGAVTGGTAAYQYSINGGTTYQAGTSFAGLLPATYTITVKDANNCTTTGTVTVTTIAAPTATVTAQVNVSCNGLTNGTATISASGGAGGYTYALNTGTSNGTGSFTGLSAAAYTVTVTDIAGCLTTTTFTITQPAVLAGSIQTQTNVSCSGGTNGSVTVTQTGGTPTYQYSLNGGAFGATPTFGSLTAASYTVTVKDSKGCTVNVPVVITQPTAIALTMSSSNANCTASNGTASVVATGGTPAYTYSWSGSGGTGATTVPRPAGTYTVTVTDANSCVKTGTVTIAVTPGGSASVSNATNVTCNGAANGSISVSMGGGSTAPFTYAWSPNVGTGSTVTNLAPGTYSVTITDVNGCTATTNTTITQPAVLNVSFTSTNVSCNGGSDGTINATATGGTAPYTYAWSPGAFTTPVVNGLPIGTYTLTVTDSKGCIKTGTRSITQPTALTITPTITNPHCGLADGSATVVGAGGAGGYTFSINGGTFGAGTFSNLIATTYTITIKDANNCTTNQPLILVDQAGPTASITTSTNVSCNGGNNGSATVTVTGGVTPYTYVWNPTSQTAQTASNLVAGVYGVVVTDASGCHAAASVTITEPSLLQINASGSDPICNGQTNGTGIASALGGTSPYTFQWATSPVQNTANATNLAAGVYSVTVTDSKGCIKTTSISLVNPPLLTATITSTNLSCFNVCNGTATAVTTNGTSPFTYLWNDPNAQTSQTATGLCAGPFSVTITDFKGCTTSAITNLTQPTLLTSTIINPVDVTCSGLCNGSGAVSPSGGTAPYNYSWSNAVSTAVNGNLCAGTYTSTVTDNNGCTTQAVLTINTPAPLVITASSTNATCYNLCDGTGTSTFSGGTAPYTFIWQPSLSTGSTATGLCDGTHTVTITDNNGCTQSATTVVTEPSQLIASTTVSNNNFCGQASGTALASVSGGVPGYTYSWSNGGTTAFISNLAGGPYSLNVTDANGCVVNAVATIVDIPGPVLTLNSSTDITCYGLNNGTASVTVTGGTAPITPQTWLLPGSLSPNPTQTGNGNSVTLWPGNNVFQVTDAAGCIASITIPILEPAQFVSAINNTTNVTCNGLSNGSTTMLVNGGSAPYQYLWTDASAQTTPTALNLLAGTYTCSVTDVNGCVSSQSVTITQPLPLVIVNNSVVNVDCYGAGNGAINITPTGGTPAYTYSWSPNGASGPVVTGLTPGIYQLQVVDSKGCTQNSAYNITQPDSFIVNTITVPSKCSNPNASVQLLVTGATPSYTYLWNSVPAQTTSTASGLSAPGSYNCLITDANGCTKSVTTSVNDLPPPTIDSIRVVDVLCNSFTNGTAIVYPKPGGSSVFTYQWLQGNTPVGASQTATGLGAGTYNVVIHDENNCEVIGVAVVTEPFPLTLTVSQDQTACNGQILGVYASAGGGTSSYNYSWSGAGSGLVGGGNHNVTYVNTTTSPLVQTYSVSVVDANNCPAVAGQFSVTVLPKITPVVANVTGCRSQVVNLNGTASGGDGAPYTFTWATTPTFTQTGTSTTTTVTVGSAASNYTLTVSDGCSTPETAVVQVSSNPVPNAGFVGINLAGCNGLPVTFSGTAGVGFAGSTYTWIFGDGSTSNDSTVVHTYYTNLTQMDSFTVTLVVTSPLGCSDTLTVSNYVTVYPDPVAEFTFSPTNATEFDPLVNFYNQSISASTYSWNFGETGSASNTSTAINPSHNYMNPGYYTVGLSVVSPKGCVDTVSHQIYIEPEFAIYVPNAFSPNEDFKNEIFLPQGIGIDEDRYQMYIFDRWGEVIFESNNLSKGWNGTAKGGSAIVQQDVYIYKIIAYDLKNQKHNLTGHVTVVR